MHVSVLMVVTASLLGVPDKPPKKKDPAKTELKKLEGTWTVVSLESMGRTYPEATIQRMNYRLTVKGNTYSWEVRNRQTIGATIKLDIKKNPKKFDLQISEGVLKGKTMLGIYALDGDTLKICYAHAGIDRPTAFATQAGIRHVLMVLKRAKP
jgi:uncharacterized protein (TIGR03067 family)